MSGFGDDTAVQTGQRALARRQGVDPLKVQCVQLLRGMAQLGGTITITQITDNRRDRRYVRQLLMLAARERLVRCPGGDRFTLTQKARDAISVGASNDVENQEAHA